MNGVIYLSHGDRHLVRLVVSIFSMRRFYSGPVVVFTSLETRDQLARILDDSRLNIDVQGFRFSNLRRHTCYVTKAMLWRASPFNATVQLDSDTVIAGPLDALFDLAGKSLVATAFSNWTVRQKIVADRLEKWRSKYPSWIEQCFSQNGRAVNTGVLAYPADSESVRPTLEEWNQLAFENWRQFIPDEIAMQLLLTNHEHIMLDDRWNCSPIYGHHKDEANIWHMHGSKHTRPEALPIWWPLYQQCIDLNVAGIRDWSPAGDKRLTEFLAKRGAA